MGTANLMVNYALEKLTEKGKETGTENVMNCVVEKSKELPPVVGNLGGNLIGKGLLYCFGRGGVGGGKVVVKMMKAPGRSLMMISRHVFESNPTAYFRGLHGKSL